VFHPIPENRVTKRYFRQWYRAYGQSMARIEPLPENTVHYFGFPRYLLLACVRYLFLWLISPTAGKRFFYKLQLLSNLCFIMMRRPL